jgi:hypothetical protein
VDSRNYPVLGKKVTNRVGCGIVHFANAPPREPESDEKLKFKSNKPSIAEAAIQMPLPHHAPDGTSCLFALIFFTGSQTQALGFSHHVAVKVLGIELAKAEHYFLHQVLQLFATHSA